MATIHRCDRCKAERGGIWSYFGKRPDLNSAAQFVPPISFDLCAECKLDLERFLNGCPLKTPWRKDEAKS